MKLTEAQAKIIEIVTRVPTGPIGVLRILHAEFDDDITLEYVERALDYLQSKKLVTTTRTASGYIYRPKQE